MRIAIVHYHYKRGGVTRIVDALGAALNTLDHRPIVACISGGDPDSDTLPGAVHVEGLGYTTNPPFPNPRDLLSRVDTAANRVLGGPPDLWHIHNPTLGKNAVWADWIRLLVERGDSLLLQPHDFAEDARPENYRYRQAHASDPSAIFPIRGGIHYGVINQRDQCLLADLGIPSESLHLLPNPVVSPCKGETRPIPTPGGRPMVLYPVRSLRRKNPGELLLAAATDPHKRFYASSLGPTNPAYLPTHQRWQAIADACQIPVQLGFNEIPNHPFADLVASADTIITTSVGEGFGLGFLEPWLFGKPIQGRNLPEITGDFTTAGVDLGPLYNSLPIPRDWLDLPALENRFRDAVQRTYEAFNLPLSPQCLDAFWRDWSHGPMTDFGKLDEIAQIPVIQRVAGGDSLPRETFDRIHPEESAQVSESRIASNRERITRSFAPAIYAERVVNAWKATLSESAQPREKADWLSPTPLVEAFLSPITTSLLRVG